MADLAVRRPFREGDLGDQLRSHPMHVAADALWWRRERWGRLLEAFELLAELERELVREAGADLAREDQPSIAIVIADQQRANARPRSFRFGEAPNHQFLAERALRLHPVAMATRAIRLIAALRNNPFEPMAAGLTEERLAVANDVLGISNAGLDPPAAYEHLQPSLAFLERQALYAVAVEAQKVEDEVRQRIAAALVGKRLLQALEAGAPVGQHNTDFAVDDRVGRA